MNSRREFCLCIIKIKNKFLNNCAILMLHVESGGRLPLKMINKLTKNKKKK